MMAATSQIRVRFAPSPTGNLHIGGARTALFNWLYARNTGGAFVLRIEDTDAVRSTEESYSAILEAMQWLGLDWDEGPVKGGPYGPYVQSARQILYHNDVQKMLERGTAYRCFCTPGELEEMRRDAVKERQSPQYDGRCRHLPADEVESRMQRSVPFVIRFRIPPGETKVNDLVRGQIMFDNSDIDDFVLIRSDGKPTYNFAAAIDDAKMRITHVIRGDDHLTNTPKQILLYQDLGYTIPKFAHLPMILGTDRTRLSKRHGAVSVQEFQRLGYSSDGLINYLALLGWSLDDKSEFFTRESLIQKFSLKRVTKNPASFDPQKLDHIDGEHFKRMPLMEKVALVFDKLQQEGIFPSDFDVSEWSITELENGERASVLAKKASNGSHYRDELPRLAIIIKVMGNRLKNLKDAPEMLAYFFKDTYPVDETACETYLSKPATAEHLKALVDALEDLPAFDRTSIEQAARSTAARLGIEAAEIIHPCRVALTGKSVSPDVFSVIHLLGREKTVERLERAVETIASAGRRS
jgi:glutamyl-tRNA synthetase